MNQVGPELSDITAIRQAILSARHTKKRAALLLIGLDEVPKPTCDGARFNPSLSDEVTIRIRAFLRDSDIVVHVDANHLAVLLSSVTGPDDAVLVALKIVERLTEPADSDGVAFGIRPRVGIALLPDHATNADTWIAQADNALKTAKRANRSYFVYCQDTIAEPFPLRMGELRQAIVADQLFLLYQPKINLREGNISGLEVLSRWQHPEFGIISPNQFIPVAERTGLIIPLTLWVLQQSLLQCRAWQDVGLDIDIAVNLSMWNLEEQQFPDQIESLLRDAGISPEKLELEITESAIMIDPHQVIQTLRYIRDLGIRFTIDDFGTGYSSLAYLKKLPVSGIKIDKSFVHNMEGDRDNAVIVRSIVDLGHNLGLTVVAEGVETYDANEMLKAYQCDQAQGFYYSRPVPAFAITDILKHPFLIFDKPQLFESTPLAKVPLETSNGHGRRQLRPKAKRA